ncbi:hypothetical protein GCM10027340_10400 [Marinomonas epiphytica]
MPEMSTKKTNGKTINRRNGTDFIDSLHVDQYASRRDVTHRAFYVELNRKQTFYE